MFKFLNKALAFITIFFIKIYQKTLSPDKWLWSPRLRGKICAHEPHCSEYSIQCLQRYWFIPWFFRAMERVSTCLPSDHKNYDPSFYKVVFFSGSPIWVPFLEALHQDERYEVVWVVSMPDMPVGRGMKLQYNVVKQKALELGITNIQTPTKLNPDKSDEGKDFVQWLNWLEADYLVLIAYGKIVPQAVLDAPKIAPINVHLSILPAYRGASPVQASLLAGEKETGITVMKINQKMDEWDIIKILKFNIDFTDTAVDIIEKITTNWPKFTNKVLRDFAKKYEVATPQDHSKATYCGKIEKPEAKIDIFHDTLESVYNKYRAFKLRPKIWLELDQNFSKPWLRVVVEQLVLDESFFEENKNLPLLNTDFRLNKAVKIWEVKPEGKKTMIWQALWNGYKK